MWVRTGLLKQYNIMKFKNMGQLYEASKKLKKMEFMDCVPFGTNDMIGTREFSMYEVVVTYLTKDLKALTSKLAQDGIKYW